jgi:hypothetical protein
MFTVNIVKLDQLVQQLRGTHSMVVSYTLIFLFLFEEGKAD